MVFLEQNNYSIGRIFSIVNFIFYEKTYCNDFYIIYAFFITKYLWNNKMLISNEENNCTWKGKFKYIEEKINCSILNKNKKQEVSTYWLYYIFEEEKICFFLGVFFSDSEIFDILDLIYNININSKWNGDFEEFIKMSSKFYENDIFEKDQFINYYDVLNIYNDATNDQIRKAYKKMIFKYHPDVYKESDAEEKTILINKAYEILSNKNLKKEYDEIYF